jgi:hypothetical protein
MQLLLRRSQRAGTFSGTMIFCLDARVQFTPAERASIQKYRLGNQVIYNSEASQRALARSEAAEDGSIKGSWKSLAYAALASMKLNISIASLERGQHVECKSLDELLGAEDAIMTACGNLRGYLDTAATFDGREVVVDFVTETPQVVAVAPALPSPPLADLPIPAPAPARPATEQHPAAALIAASAAHVEQAAPTPPGEPLVQYELENGEAVPVTSTRIRGVASDSAAAAGDDEVMKVILGITAAFVVILILVVIYSLQPR